MLVKTIALPKEEAENLIKTLVFIGVVVIIPSLIHIQWITGPIVNAILFLAVILVGGRNALLIGLIPSIIALYFGLLPAPLAPLIPFIMISNAILVVLFDWLKKNYWTAIIVAATVKFLFLHVSTSTIMDLILRKELAPKVAQILSWPQFYTALIGGFIAWIFIKFYKVKISK
jgi:riboflavin transporter